MISLTDRCVQILDAMQGQTILVLGDVMLDEFVLGDVRRISPEAPVPIVEYRVRHLIAGGAANVAANVARLGCHAILCGVVGEDENADNLRADIEFIGISPDGLIGDHERPTTVKLRILANNQQIVRLDREVRKPIRPELEAAVLRWLQTNLTHAKVCILSDYAKGVVTPHVAREAIAACNAARVPILIDPKGLECHDCIGATLVKPNKHEAERLAGREINNEEDFEAVGCHLADALRGTAVLITRGSQGMSLFREGQESHRVIAALRNLYDGTGAGDTVISTMAASLAAGASLEDAVWLANNAAAIVVAKPGTAPISATELREAPLLGHHGIPVTASFTFGAV